MSWLLFHHIGCGLVSVSKVVETIILRLLLISNTINTKIAYSFCWLKAFSDAFCRWGPSTSYLLYSIIEFLENLFNRAIISLNLFFWKSLINFIGIFINMLLLSSFLNSCYIIYQQWLFQISSQLDRWLINHSEISFNLEILYKST